MSKHDTAAATLGDSVATMAALPQKTVVTFYQNGFVIRNHTKPDICGELSMFTWTVTQLMLNLEYTGEYVTDEVTGYGHFYFNHENETLSHMFSVAKQMLPMWAKKYGWHNFVAINEQNELFRPKASDPTEIAQAEEEVSP